MAANKRHVRMAIVSLALAVVVGIIGPHEAGADHAQMPVTACFAFPSGERYTNVVYVYYYPDATGRVGVIEVRANVYGCATFYSTPGLQIWVQAYHRPRTQSDCAWTQRGDRGWITLGNNSSIRLQDTLVTRRLECSA